MPILNYEAFAQCLPKRGALIGIDPGSKTIGVAVSDPTRTIASPVSGVKRTKMIQDGAQIFAILTDRLGCALVIGHPLNMNGTKGPSSQSAHALARNLLAIRDVPVLMWDERLSTAAVLRQMISADMSRNKRAAVVDAAAASYMLQGLLDRLHSDIDRRPSS